MPEAQWRVKPEGEEGGQTPQEREKTTVGKEGSLWVRMPEVL